LCAELEDQNTLNTMGLIRLNTTITLPGVVKQTLKSIYCTSKQNKVNHALICLNAWIAKANTKQIQINAHSGEIDLTRNNI